MFPVCQRLPELTLIHRRIHRRWHRLHGKSEFELLSAYQIIALEEAQGLERLRRRVIALGAELFQHGGEHGAEFDDVLDAQVFQEGDGAVSWLEGGG